VSTVTGTCPCDGHCCRRYAVNVCGYDAWLISTRRRLRPEQFLVTYALPAPRSDGFHLAPDGPPLGLLLDKRGRKEQGPLKLSLPCVFLVTLTDGIERCGIYAERPIACRSYPMLVTDGEIRPRPDALCPLGCWRLDDETRATWGATLRHQSMQLTLYADVVEHWNARVAALELGAPLSVLEYFSYLMNVYDRLDRLGRELGYDTMSRVTATWPMAYPAPAATDPSLPWVNYRRRARAELHTFYRPAAPG